jgi:hypothetical protein
MSRDGWKAMPGQPRACAGCGERVTLKREAILLDIFRRLTSHFRCRPRTAKR